MARRVTIYLRDAAQQGPDLTFTEHVPYGGESFDDHGVTFDWGGGVESFFPYSNIIRVDFEPEP